MITNIQTSPAGLVRFGLSVARIKDAEKATERPVWAMYDDHPRTGKLSERQEYLKFTVISEIRNRYKGVDRLRVQGKLDSEQLAAIAEINQYRDSALETAKTLSNS